MSEYSYAHAEHPHAHGFLLPVLAEALRTAPAPRRIFEVGCGNGATANWLRKRGYDVIGIDASESGIAQASDAYPDCNLRVGSAYDPLAAQYGTFDTVISLEVVEHLYSPRAYAETSP